MTEEISFMLEFIDAAAEKEYKKLRGTQKDLVDNGLARLIKRADKIGKPLSGALAGCRELKFRADGIRIIYRILSGKVEIVQIIAIGKRENSAVFKDATARIAGNGA